MVSSVGAVLARLVHFQGVQQSLLHQQSKWCISARLVHLRQVHPLKKKNPNRGSPLLGFPFYICFSDIYLTSTFLDVPSLILTTLMPF